MFSQIQIGMATATRVAKGVLRVAAAGTLVLGLASGAAADGGTPAHVRVSDADVHAHLFAAPALELGMAGPRMKGDEGYNSDYLFGMSRAIANSTMVPAVKPLVWIITVPLDIALLPFTLIGGFFG